MAQGVLKFSFGSALLQQGKCSPKDADILFHIVGVIAAAHQLQVSNADFQKAVKSTESTAGGTAEISIRQFR